MLTETECSIVQETMRSDEFSEACFLGKEELLQNRIDQDRAALASTGITTKQIADILNSVLTVFRNETEPRGALIRAAPSEKSSNSAREKESNIEVPNWWVRRETNKRWRVATIRKQENRFRLVGSLYAGCQECPYSCLDRFSACRNVLIGDCDLCIQREDASGKKLEFGALLVHLIKEHEFFEGKDVLYRLDPLHIVEFFDMVPGCDYSGWFQARDVEIESLHANVKD